MPAGSIRCWWVGGFSKHWKRKRPAREPRASLRDKIPCLVINALRESQLVPQVLPGAALYGIHVTPLKSLHSESIANPPADGRGYAWPLRIHKKSGSRGGPQLAPKKSPNGEGRGDLDKFLAWKNCLYAIANVSGSGLRLLRKSNSQEISKLQALRLG